MYKLLSFALSILLFPAQQTPVRIQGQYDQEIVTPSSAGKPLGQADPAALTELAAYKLATGGADWAGYSAQGRMFFDGGTDALAAALMVLPGNRTRLDLTRPTGHDITVFNGLRGATTYAGAKKVLMAPRGATAGLAPFDLALTAVTGGLAFSIIDHGTATVQSQALHRISIEKAIPQKYLFPYEKDDRLVVDMYFDPSTHLLVKTASMIPIPGSSAPVLLKVDSYSAYKHEGLALFLPTTVDETINGQEIWKLVLDSIDTSKIPAISNFLF